VTDYSYKSIPFIGGEVDKCILWLSFTQGDQIGRMFDHRVAEYFGQFTMNGLGISLGDFFLKNSSGHPGFTQQKSVFFS
jgi:hypothetical protein